MLISKPISLNYLITSFLILSVFCPFSFLIRIKPSSLYKPEFPFGILFANVDKTRALTCSQTSAPSYMPIVTSKQLSEFFFFHASFSWYYNDFLQCLIIRMSLSEISTCCFANDNAYLVSFPLLRVKIP